MKNKKKKTKNINYQVQLKILNSFSVERLINLYLYKPEKIVYHYENNALASYLNIKTYS